MSSIIKRKTFKRILLIFAAVVIAAGLTESLFFIAGKKSEPAEYSTEYFGADGFTAVECEVLDETDGCITFKTLANDSYFELKDLNISKAQSIELYFEREPGDNSEMVLKFTGASNGVKGTFTAGIKRISEGVYRAVADYDRIESLRIYPTEKTAREIVFSGIRLNPAVVKTRFSLSRAFLWAVLLAALIRIAVAVIGQKKKRTVQDLWTTVYLITNAGVSLFTYISTFLFWTAKQIGLILVPAVSVTFSLCFLLLYLIAVKVKKFHIKASLLFITAGLVFTFATAPLQVPDEGNHFARCYAISTGSFAFDGSYEYPDDVELFYLKFADSIKMAEDFHALPSARDRLLEYLYQRKSGTEFEGKRKVFSNSQIIVPYIPSAFGILIVRLFTTNTLAALYAGRLMSMLMVSLAVLFSLKRAIRHRTPLLITIFFPLTVFLAASTSYDSFLLAALIVFIGILLADDISKKDIAVLLLAYCIIVSIKPLYIPLVLLILMIPKSSFRVKGNYLLTMGAVAAAGILCWQLTLLYAGLFSKNIESAGVLPGVDKSAQLLYILRNPFKTFIVMMVDGFRKNFYLGEFGLFGHLDLAAMLTTIVSPVQIVLCAALSGTKREKTKPHNLLLILMLVLMYITISAGFYVVDSSLGGSTILGIQARYFIPSVFVFSCLLGSIFSNFINARSQYKAELLTLWSGFLIAAVASTEVLTGYYL